MKYYIYKYMYKYVLQIVEFVKSEELDSTVIQMLWERFTMKVPNTTPEDSRAALLLLSMAAG